MGSARQTPVQSATTHSDRVRLRFLPLDYAAAMGMFFYAASATVTPIALVILAREFAFTLRAGGAIEVARSGLLLAALLASGFIAARCGKPISLGASCLAIGGGLLIYSLAPAYGAIVLAMVVVGLGGGIFEGLLNPLVQDLHPGNSGRYLNIVNGFWSLGVLTTMLIVGDLLTREVSWRWIAAGLGIFTIVGGALFLAMQRGAPAAQTFNVSKVMAHKRDIIIRPRFWLFMALMFFAGAAEGAFTFWSATFIQLHHGTAPRAGGIGAALFAAGMVGGRFASGLWVTQRRLRRMLLSSAIVGIVASALVPLAPNLPEGFAALFISGLSISCFWPSIQSYAADRLPVESTSLFILLSCAGIPGFAFASWAIGLLGGAVGLQRAFLTIPFLFIALALLLIIERAWPTHSSR